MSELKGQAAIDHLLDRLDQIETTAFANRMILMIVLRGLIDAQVFNKSGLAARLRLTADRFPASEIRDELLVLGQQLEEGDDPFDPADPPSRLKPAPSDDGTNPG
ncbi:hypothetical protein GCM10007385_35220 [Tateyamaria omphalii]|uniref:hypothetical protein n=1 Tax=Tateyamaria omphalii TaxID=299262 RepID=UPI001674AD43|nr:hypothetical protein [Tateyamaria omphalii]GGX63048.1 hypothetical protein GCM10007385_35220 [Tateyamaria omphalii]